MTYQVVEGWKLGERAIECQLADSQPLFLAGDLHYGYKDPNGNALKWFQAFLDDVHRRKGKFILMGDMMETAIPSHMPHAGIMFTQQTPPDEQRRALTDLLRPHRDNIVAILSGTHEKRIAHYTGEGNDPTSIMCEMLDVPFVPISAFVRVAAGTQRYTGYVRHGHGGSQNPLYELVKEVGARLMNVDFVGLAHIHQLEKKPFFGRYIDDDGFVRAKTCWGVRTGGFLRDPAYAVDAGFTHSGIGYVTLTFDGNKHEMDEPELVRMGLE